MLTHERLTGQGYVVVTILIQVFHFDSHLSTSDMSNIAPQFVECVIKLLCRIV